MVSETGSLSCIAYLSKAWNQCASLKVNNLTGELDVAIVGGGAAGIAAARRLLECRRKVLLIEALPQLGGRARTAVIEGMPLDLGCGWLHSAERNLLRAVAEAQGVTVDRRPSAWGNQLRNLGFSTDEQEQAWDAYEALCTELRDAPPTSDRASDALAAQSRWRPFMDALSSFINGTELGTLSARDFSAYDSASSSNNWRGPSGYGAFIAGLGAALPQMLGTFVSSVRQENGGIRLDTDQGPVTARAAVVCVSSNVLASGRIRFDPQVDDHLHAAASLPLGLANKVFLRLRDPELVPAESHLLGRPDRAATASHYIRPLGHPVVESYFGGAHAHDMEKAGKDAAIAFAVEELRHLLGSDFAKSLSPIAVSEWGKEGSIGGSYSHALPGHAAARATLAKPVSERLCFAGEACSASDFSTAHGAWETGLAAADWIDQSL